MTIRIDARDFKRGLALYAHATGKTQEQVVTRQAKNVAIKLYREAAALTPSVELLKSLPDILQSQGKGVKRPVGVTVAQEIKRRISHRFAAARGWSTARKIRPGVTSIETAAGEVRVHTGPHFFIELINKMRSGLVAEQKHQYVQQAVNATAADMTAYALKKIGEQNKKIFGKAASFGRTILRSSG